PPGRATSPSWRWLGWGSGRPGATRCERHLFLQPHAPVLYDRERLHHSVVDKRVDEKPGPVRGNVVLGTEVAPPDLRLEERLRRSDRKRRSGLDLGGHECLLGKLEKEDLLSVPSPSGNCAAAGGDLPFLTQSREGLYVDLELSGLVRGVGQPSSVGSELG